MKSNKVEQAVGFAIEHGLEISKPKPYVFKGCEFNAGTRVFDYDKDNKIIACDPLGALVYENIFTYKGKVDYKDAILSMGTAFIAKILREEYEDFLIAYTWLEGFYHGWNCLRPYVPKDDFNLRTYYSAEAWDFAIGLSNIV